MSNVFYLSDIFSWRKTPAFQREQELAEEWDKLSDEEKDYYGKKPGLFRVANFTNQEVIETNELVRKLSTNDFETPAERRALVCRLDQLYPYLKDHECNDWIFKPESERVTSGLNRPAEETTPTESPCPIVD